MNAGDPLQHNICVMFGNEDGNHWYTVILDNREGRKMVLYLDSAANYTTTDVQRRCSFHVDIVNDFRKLYLRDELNMALDSAIPDVTKNTHPFVVFKQA